VAELSESTHRLSATLVERVARLPVDAQRVIALGCLQRCYPFYLRSIDAYPARQEYRPAIDRGLALAWARHEGRAVEEDDVRAVAAELLAFTPESADDLIGDDSWVALTFRCLADALHLTQYESWEDYVLSALTTTSDLVYYWYGYVEFQAGRAFAHADQKTSSAYLLEMATLARHNEWLRFAPVDAEIVRRMRVDSERVGIELVTILEEWERAVASR
jgi:hypothetical protein